MKGKKFPKIQHKQKKVSVAQCCVERQICRLVRTSCRVLLLYAGMMQKDFLNTFMTDGYVTTKGVNHHVTFTCFFFFVKKIQNGKYKLQELVLREDHKTNQLLMQ